MSNPFPIDYAMASWPDSLARKVVILGEAVDFALVKVVASSFVVVRAPAGSVAVFSGTSFTPDVVGLYTIDRQIGALPKSRYTIVCLAAAALTFAQNSDPQRASKTKNGRDILTSLCNNGPSDAELIASIETAAHVWPHRSPTAGDAGFGNSLSHHGA